MAKQKLTSEQFERKTLLYKNVLLENFKETFEQDEKNDSLLLHKSSNKERNFFLFIDLHAKVNKVIVGVKSLSTIDKLNVVNRYEITPLDQKGRLHDAQKYTSVTNEIKFDDLNEKVINEINVCVNFYSETFKEFLN